MEIGWSRRWQVTSVTVSSPKHSADSCVELKTSRLRGVAQVHCAQPDYNHCPSSSEGDGMGLQKL